MKDTPMIEVIKALGTSDESKRACAVTGVGVLRQYFGERPEFQIWRRTQEKMKVN